MLILDVLWLYLQLMTVDEVERYQFESTHCVYLTWVDDSSILYVEWTLHITYHPFATKLHDLVLEVVFSAMKLLDDEEPAE